MTEATGYPVVWPRRPGGFTITERALAFCAFSNGAVLVDIGCGTGATVRHIGRRYPFTVYGCDKDRRYIPGGEQCLCARAEHIPFADCTADGILMECSLSKTDDPAQALRECVRILKPSGYAMISDLYARGEATRLKGRVGRIERRETFESLLSGHTLTVELFEDFTLLLHAFWGQMIFENGFDPLSAEINADATALKRIRCGYCLFIARKKT